MIEKKWITKEEAKKMFPEKIQETLDDIFFYEMPIKEYEFNKFKIMEAKK